MTGENWYVPLIIKLLIETCDINCVTYHSFDTFPFPACMPASTMNNKNKHNYEPLKSQDLSEQ